MKNLTSLSVYLFFSGICFSQVGINTTEPTSTLDVNGNLRVRSMADGYEGDGNFAYGIRATKIVGLDEEGNFVPVDLDENIYLEDNVLKVRERKVEISSFPTFTADKLHNLIIFPGGANDPKSIVRLNRTEGGGSMEITGIDVTSLGGPNAADGITVWLYPISGKLKLKKNSTSSYEKNRIQAAYDIEVEQYGMIRIMYDAQIQKWVVMINDHKDDMD